MWKGEDHQHENRSNVQMMEEEMIRTNTISGSNLAQH